MGQVVERYIATSRAEGRSDQPVRAPCMVKPNKKANKKTMSKTTSRIKPTTKFTTKSQKDSIPEGTECIQDSTISRSFQTPCSKSP